MPHTITEVERRFLTLHDDWHALRNDDHKLFIKQAYPDSLQGDGKFGRVRSSWNPATDITIYEQCVKEAAVELETRETEWEITPTAFEELTREAAKAVLNKWRWLVEFEDHEFAVDQFAHIRHDRSDLVITEIEFTSTDEAIAFDPPLWLGLEVTGNHRYSNYELCMHGEPVSSK